jgi:hypothetical protein
MLELCSTWCAWDAHVQIVSRLKTKHTHVSAGEDLPSAATHARSAAMLSVALNPCIQISCLQTARTNGKTCHPTSLACKAVLSVAAMNSSIALSTRMTPHTHTVVLAVLGILLFQLFGLVIALSMRMRCRVSGGRWWGNASISSC